MANHCLKVLNNCVSVYVCGAQQQHDSFYLILINKSEQ